MSHAFDYASEAKRWIFKRGMAADCTVAPTGVQPKVLSFPKR